MVLETDAANMYLRNSIGGTSCDRTCLSSARKSSSSPSTAQAPIGVAGLYVDGVLEVGGDDANEDVDDGGGLDVGDDCDIGVFVNDDDDDDDDGNNDDDDDDSDSDDIVDKDLALLALILLIIIDFSRLFTIFALIAS